MRWLLAGGALVVLGVAAFAVLRRPGMDDDGDSPAAGREVALPAPGPLQPPPTRTSSPYRNTEPDVAYVGSQACMECHADETHGYKLTRHSRSMSATPGDVGLPEADILHAESGFAYRSVNRDGRTVHEELVLGPRGSTRKNCERTIEYSMGSRNFGSSFLFLIDGFVGQSPVTWYTDRAAWGLAPGYEGQQQYSFRREVSIRCLLCHAGHVTPIDGNEFRVDVHEAAIGCERCHGPGALHVEKYESLAGLANAGKEHVDDPAGSPQTADEPSDAPAGDSSLLDDTIVNPARLSRELSEAICQQCHLQGEADVDVRGAGLLAYRPGLPLHEYRRDYAEVREEGMRVVGHIDQMHQSACYQQSTTLSCTTCHNLHAGERLGPAERAAELRRVCLDCHRPENCALPEADRQAQAEDHCAKCHMPAAPTEVPHVAFTHHRIGVHDAQAPPGVRTSPRTDGLDTLIPIAPCAGPDEARNRGLALIKLAARARSAEEHQQRLERAQQLLEEAWRSGAGDGPVASGLALAADMSHRRREAVAWARIALELEPQPSSERIAALEIVAEDLFNRQQNEEALAAFNELTAQRRQARHWLYRGMCEQNLDRTPEAIASIEKSIEIYPRQPSAHQSLAAIYQMLKNEEQMQRHLQLQRELAEPPRR